MSAVVFDSSVLIAILRQEPGSEVGERFLNETLISTVNLAEVATYAECLYPSGKHLGLSLGDRACLALAKSRNLPVLTADKVWLDLDLGVSIETIR